MIRLPGSRTTCAGPIVRMHRRDPLLVFAAAAIGIVLAAVQWAGGAWSAEFDAHPDESAQFISGRVLWEYLRTLPPGSPLDWAGQYYLHYPKVAIGHWPPLYPAAEALWSLVFGSSRSSAMGLQWLLGVAALIGLYTLARNRLPLPITAGILLVIIATPVFQQSLEQSMADLACLLLSILFMHAMLRLTERADGRSALLVALVLFAAGMTKGTAVALLPVPAVVLLVERRRITKISAWQCVAGAALLAICIAWYAATTNVRSAGGVTSRIPWPVGQLGALAGWGFVALAFFGLQRKALPVIAASMIASAAAVSFGLRAMLETRHWIIVLPAVLLLAGYGVSRFPRRYMALPPAAALLLFPFSWFHQKPDGYVALLHQLHLPARILISSGRPGGEGAWIAEVAIADHYPGSLVARASKTLARSNWEGNRYELLEATPAAAARRLDELALDVVVIDLPAATKWPHQAVLRRMLAGSSCWKPCARADNLEAYCRAMPPKFPRRLLVVEAEGRRFQERLGP
jgi:hypothetical protein